MKPKDLFLLLSKTPNQQEFVKILKSCREKAQIKTKLSDEPKISASSHQRPVYPS